MPARCFFLLLFMLTSAHALTSAELQQFIDEAIQSKDGGEVVIPPGRHVLERALIIRDAQKLRITGLDAETTVLALAPAAFAICVQEAKAGETVVRASRMQELKPGMDLRIEAEGEIDAFTKKPKPYHLAKVKAVRENEIELAAPLKFPCPAGTMLRDLHAPNLIELRGKCDKVLISKLTLDGGRTEADPLIRGHSELCGIFAQGDYSYEKGPTGPKVRGVMIDRCFIQNCHGRGIALYSCEDVRIEKCTIRDTSDEAIDLDHFTSGAVLRHNHVARSLVGVELNDASGCVVEQNDFLECGTGINLWRWCKQAGLNEKNVIRGNEFLRTKGNGVQLASGTALNTVTENTILDSGKNGIVINGTDQMVKDNTIRGSRLKDVVKVK